MKFSLVQGKNFKSFIKIDDLKTKQDMELFDIVKDTVSRSEYKPFMQGFNKTISYTYLFNDIYFPVSFWTDVKKRLIQIVGKDSNIIKLENEDSLFNLDILRPDFDEWIQNCKFPEEIYIDNEVYMYQQDSVYLALFNKIGRINVATSGGKTFITYLYCRYLIDHIINEDKEEKILIVVPSKLLVNQLKKDFTDYDKHFERHISIESIFAGSKRLLGADVVCGTFQSLSNYDEEYFEPFKVMIADEVHTSKTYSVRNEIYAKLLNCTYYFGMSGSMPAYKTLDYLHLVSMFGAELVKKKAIELIRDGVATPIHVNIVKIEYQDQEQKNYIKKLSEEGIVGLDKLAEEKVFFHSNQKRNNLIVKLMSNDKYFGNTLILVDTVEYAQYLHDFLSEKLNEIGWEITLIYGEIKDRDDIIEGMRNSINKYCIIGTFKTMSTGISIKNLFTLYLPDCGKAEGKLKQTIGRMMRLFPGKLWADIFDFHDQIPGSSFYSHGKERIKIYQLEEHPIKYITVKL